MLRAFQQAVVIPLTPPGSAHSEGTAAVLELLELPCPVALTSDDWVESTLVGVWDLIVLPQFKMQFAALEVEFKRLAVAETLILNVEPVFSGAFEVVFWVVVAVLPRKECVLDFEITLALALWSKERILPEVIEGDNA